MCRCHIFEKWLTGPYLPTDLFHISCHNRYYNKSKQAWQWFSANMQLCCPVLALWSFFFCCFVVDMICHHYVINSCFQREKVWRILSGVTEILIGRGCGNPAVCAVLQPVLSLSHSEICQQYRNKYEYRKSLYSAVYAAENLFTCPIIGKNDM